MRFLKSEAGAIVIWLLASLFTAALFTPWLYIGGKRLVYNALVYDFPAFLQWLAAACDRAKPERYFSRSMMLSAVVLLPFLVRRVKNISRSTDRDLHSLRKQTIFQSFLHITSGLVISISAIFVLCVALRLTGVIGMKEVNLSLSKILTKALFPALSVSLIEEFLFRGLLLGLWLRAYSVRVACIGSSLVFAFLHFLKPLNGMVIADATAWYSGFEILASALNHCADPLFFITHFTMLTFLGFILAYCRTCTFSLWLPIGLHAGLVFSFKMLFMTQQFNHSSPLIPWCIGPDMKSGIFPLFVLCLCFAACWIFVRKFNRGEQLEQPLV